MKILGANMEIETDLLEFMTFQDDSIFSDKQKAPGAPE